jgi:hypothetical protein
MSGWVLVAAYMSDPIPCWYRTSSMSCVSECVEGDWSVDRIAPVVMGICVLEVEVFENSLDIRLLREHDGTLCVIAFDLQS